MEHRATLQALPIHLSPALDPLMQVGWFVSDFVTNQQIAVLQRSLDL